MNRIFELGCSMVGVSVRPFARKTATGSRGSGMRRG